MNEYLEWREDGGPAAVRVHRRVIAGLEREPKGELRGVVFGVVSGDGNEVDVEDFAVTPPGSSFQGGHSLTPVGSFRVAPDAERLTASDHSPFERDLKGRGGVVLLFQREGDRIEWNDVAVRRALPEGRRAVAPLDESGEHRKPHPRYFWPAVVAAAFAVIIGAAYVTADRDARRAQARADGRGKDTRPPLADWKPVDPPAAPTVAPPMTRPVAEQRTGNDADRTTDAGHAVSPAGKAQVKQQVRDTLEDWRKALLAENVDQYVNLYAPSVGPYFRENRVSRDQIAAEVRRMLGRYGAMDSYKISDVTIAPVDENHAVANFRKEWRTARNAFAGAEKAQLRFERQNGKWLITSEQELRVYWARKR